MRLSNTKKINIIQNKLTNLFQANEKRTGLIITSNQVICIFFGNNEFCLEGIFNNLILNTGCISTDSISVLCANDAIVNITEFFDE